MRAFVRSAKCLTRRLGAVAAGVVALFGVLALPALDAAAQEGAAEDGLDVVGQMVRPNDHAYLRPMSVDSKRSLGFVTDTGAVARLYLMDLERLKTISSAPQGIVDGYSPESTLALDPTRERLYATSGFPPTLSVDTACTNLPDTPVFDYRAGPDGQRQLRRDSIGPMPCSGQVRFFGLTNAYDEKSDRLYLGGVPATERWRYEPSDRTPLPALLGGTMEEDRGQALLVRQLKIDGDALLSEVGGTPADLSKASQLRLEWEIDLRLAGCGRRQHVSRTVFEGFIVRLGDDVLAYCWDARAHQLSSVGQQGYLVRIPLVRDPADGIMKPQTRGVPVVDPLTNQITNYVARRIPTLPGSLTPIVDHESGRVMLVSTGPTNGNAVWVLDPLAERFVGVITGGYADEPLGNTAVGFDAQRGRVYLLTQHGVLIAPVRSDPLPAGLIHPVLVNSTRKKNFVSSQQIAVAPRLGRLFVAMNDNNDSASSSVRALDDHYEVLEDRLPEPPEVEPLDPDSLTTQVKEKEGKTVSSTGGQAIASGAHIVNTGGLPRAVGQNDPTCVLSPPNVQITSPGSQQNPIPNWEIAPALFGSCAAELIVSAGHREAVLADARLEAGSGSGATARGAGFAFGSTDVGSDSDIRRASDCGGSTPDRVDSWGRRWPLPPDARIDGSGSADSTTAVIGGENKKPFVDQYNSGRDRFWSSWKEQREEGQGEYAAGCNSMQDQFAGGSSASPTGPIDLRAGTRGPDGRGAAVRAAVCGDFGGGPTADTWPSDAAGAPQVGYPAANASCDAAVPGGHAGASNGVLAVPSAADAQLSVARVISRVATSRTPADGQMTIAFSSASGVQVGPLAIAEVRSLAVAKARGRTGTTSAVLVRQWCGISVGGETHEGCVDATSEAAKDLLDEVSSGLLYKVQLSVPEGETQATPGGYQAVVTKHPGQRGADQAVNDDDSHTVSALQAVVYSDGPRGRSRVVVQLAGVHAESRYGIIELPNFNSGPGGTNTPPPAQTDPGTTTDPGPVAPEAGPAPGPLPDTFTPGSFVDEFVTEEIVRTQPAAPAPRFVAPPPAGSPLERIVRVPVKALSDAINLLVQHPREFALLFLMFSLLSAPAYLGLRRRSFARALVST